MRISDWSSDVCSSDLAFDAVPNEASLVACHAKSHTAEVHRFVARTSTEVHGGMGFTDLLGLHYWFKRIGFDRQVLGGPEAVRAEAAALQGWTKAARSEEHTSELQSLMRISYAVFCLKKKKTRHTYKYLPH